ncbi:MAG: BamA/TamA family outer membrane protein [Flavobacteriaceae bacterium]|nr:outer membrane protein assembly factor [Muriicola sp.]MBT8290388.1 outer membrane protein assembly factor [Muriicola sp.]NNC61371.1 BamA/TamA family outer membrane protein [Eudoraea sp.]NNK35584.1 BamA/TamA family outer membrane protein [Eudoraea sp.]NNL40079.1 BamA/TamA family outer membrane protein [Flavobacteriaceae bacterium]
MNTPFPLKGIAAKIGIFLLIALLSSCNTLKRVGEDELLLTKNTILVDGEKILDEDIKSLIVQEPNTRVLGYPLRLNLYNLAKKDPDSTFQAWLNKKPGREERLANLLSQKQVDALGESFFVKGYSEWLKKIGEAPVVIDTSRARKTLQRLNSFYGSKGYFNNSTTFEIREEKRKQRAAIDYNVTLGNPYFIDSLSRNIASPAIDSLYQITRENSFIKEKKQFDLTDFNNERQRLTELFRNSGVYNFQESSITYDILRDTTEVRDDQQMNVELNIDNLRKRSDTAITTSEYKVFSFDKINIYADYEFGDETANLQSTEFENYTIYFKEKLRYKPKALTDAIFFEKDSLYRDLDRLRTYRQITNLNTFKYPNIQILEDSTQTKLISNIFLTARPKYSLGLNLDITHSNIQRLGIGFSSSLITRNVFGGAETLSLSARGTFGLLSDTSLPEDFFSEVGADINLTFPRIWFPLLNTKRIIPNFMLPKTSISAGTSFQKNIGLDKQTLNSILSYGWVPNTYKRNSLELLNILYVRNVNPDRFFNVYTSTYESLDDIADNYEDDPALADFFDSTDDPDDPNLIIPEGTTGFTQAVLDGTITTDTDDFIDVSRIEERRDRLTENNLIFSSNYTFTKNNKSGINDNSFYQFRLNLESAGNLLSGLSYLVPFNQNDNDNLLVFGVPYSQYVKTEFDFIKHWDLSRSNVLAFRSFLGVAIPYGNSESVPFVRSYFAGGSNDNRAWFPYSLGPGSSSDINDFNEANLKMAFNLEYRFPIVGNIKGALFADAGNIWNVWDNVDDPAKTFSGFESLADIALGTGFGLRYDFTYFVFRVDTGFKTYNPAEVQSKRWFRDYNFGNAVIQIGINYPF